MTEKKEDHRVLSFQPLDQAQHRLRLESKKQQFKTKHMQDFEEQKRYEHAKKKVDDERGFYTHLTFYIVINLVVLFINTNFESQGFKNWLQWHLYITPVLWGIGLLFHGLCVFKNNFILGKGWEKRKIKELMEKDDTLDVL